MFLGGLFLMSCAGGPNIAAHTLDANGNLAGFWLGLWHGIIAPITLVISIFTNSVNCYEVHNNGGWYNFGFVLGTGVEFGAGWSTVWRKD